MGIPSLGGGLPELGVKRPWLTLVMNLLIAIAGIAALLAIEVRELPDVDRPIVSVRALMPGASPETMDATVTSLVEGAVARVNGVKEIRSSSEENNTRIWIEFRPDVDVDRAASDVREAVSRIERELPDAVEQLSVFKADEQAEEIIRIAVKSSDHSEEDLNQFIEQDIVPRFISLPGVADVPRIAIDTARENSIPMKLSSLGSIMPRNWRAVGFARTNTQSQGSWGSR